MGRRRKNTDKQALLTDLTLYVVLAVFLIVLVIIQMIKPDNNRSVDVFSPVQTYDVVPTSDTYLQNEHTLSRICTELERCGYTVAEANADNDITLGLSLADESAYCTVNVNSARAIIKTEMPQLPDSGHTDSFTSQKADIVRKQYAAALQQIEDVFASVYTVFGDRMMTREQTTTLHAKLNTQPLAQLTFKIGFFTVSITSNSKTITITIQK